MDYVRLGRTGLRVSRICLGMMSFGRSGEREWTLDEDGAEPIVRRAVEGGVTFFDTADVYNHGQSEVITGNLLRKQAEGSRGVVIQTGAGIVAHTDRARIDGMRASGKDPVRVEGPGYVLTADSFDASLEDGDFEFAGRVTTRFERQR